MTSVVSLYVGKLPMDITRQQMQELFEPYRPGRIDLRHGKSYDFGFVEIPAEMADEAVTRMHRLFSSPLKCLCSCVHFDECVFFFRTDAEYCGSQLIVEIAHGGREAPRRERLRPPLSTQRRMHISLAPHPSFFM